DRARGTPVFSFASSKISPFGHQIRVLEPATAHALSFGANDATRPTHPVPSCVPFLTTDWSAIAGLHNSVRAVAINKQRMTSSHHCYCISPSERRAARDHEPPSHF